MEEVALNKCGSYDQAEVYSSVRQAIDKLGGIEKFIRPGQKVLLKPNVLGGYKPEEAVTTHPEVVRAVVRLVKSVNAYPSIGESPGIGSLKRYAGITGIKNIADEENVPLIEFTTPKEVSFPGGKRFKSLTLAAEIFDYDVMVNLPKFKTHGFTGITGAAKNLYGCVPGVLKSENHFKLKTRDLLVTLVEDIARFIKPVLNIMDAVWAMEGVGGPSAGKPKFMGILAVASNSFALDEAMLEVINGGEVQGFSCPDFEQVDITRQDIFHLPFPTLQKLYARYLAERPVINAKKCTNCGTCVKVCAAKAISADKTRPRFDYSKCIRCFCCQEMCPERAIFVHRNRFAEALNGVLGRV